jgi:hypothetical protein
LYDLPRPLSAVKRAYNAVIVVQVAQQVLLMQQGKMKGGTPLNTYGDPVRKAGKSLSASGKKTPVKRSRGRGRAVQNSIGK